MRGDGGKAPCTLSTRKSGLHQVPAALILEENPYLQSCYLLNGINEKGTDTNNQCVRREQGTYKMYE
jgi:hypothetical protein